MTTTDDEIARLRESYTAVASEANDYLAAVEFDEDRGEMRPVTHHLVPRTFMRRIADLASPPQPEHGKG